MAKAGLQRDEFLALKNTPTENLTPHQIDQLKTVRESIPMPTSETMLQKVIPESDIAKYLSGQYVAPSGFIAKQSDLAGIQRYDDMVEALRLDYLDQNGLRSAFPEGGNSYGIIRYQSESALEAKIPYNQAFGGSHISDPPFTGNGFTGSRDGSIIPEYSIARHNELALPKDGAELIRVENGIEKVVGKYDDDKGVFLPIK